MTFCGPVAKSFRRKPTILYPSEAVGPNPKCYICNSSMNQLEIKLDTNITTLGYFVKEILQNQLSLAEPCVDGPKGGIYDHEVHQGCVPCSVANVFSSPESSSLPFAASCHCLSPLPLSLAHEGPLVHSLHHTDTRAQKVKRQSYEGCAEVSSTSDAFPARQHYRKLRHSAWFRCPLRQVLQRVVKLAMLG